MSTLLKPKPAMKVRGARAEGPSAWMVVPALAFFLVFAGSVVLTFADLEATRLATLGSGFPGWVVVPQGVAKALGLLAILSRWSPLLTGLAFAGFLYDTLLALGAHLVQQDLPNSALATTGLLATLAAYRAHRRRYPAG